MDGEERESNSGGGVVLGLVAKNGEAVKKLKGYQAEVENGDGNSAWSSAYVFRTYKRRKHTKVVDNGKVSGDSASQTSDKSIRGPPDIVLTRSSCMQAGIVHVKPHGLLNDPSHCTIRDWKNVVLQQIFQSLESDGGLKESIHDAFASHPEASGAAKVKESQKSCKDWKRCSLPSHFVHQGIRNGMNAVSNGAVNEPSHCTVTKLCQHMFIDIVISEKFTQLCNVLYENFEGTKADNFFDVSLIHTRMKDGSYEGSPFLFHSDIQQVEVLWTTYTY